MGSVTPKIPNTMKQVEAEKLSEKLKRMSSTDAANFILASEKLPFTVEDTEMTSTPEPNIEYVDNEEFKSLMAADCLKVSPSLVHFFNGAAVINLSNSNCANIVLAYKVRTTSPEKFRVRPSQGLIRCGTTVKVAFTLLPGYHIDSEDKFIILGMDMGHERRAIVDHAEMSGLWSLCPKHNQVEHKLKCVVKRHEPLHTSLVTNLEEKGAILISTTEILLNDTSRLRKEVYSVRKTMLYIIVIQFLVVVALLHYQFEFANQARYY